MICHYVPHLLESKTAHVRAISALVARTKLESLFAINSDLECAVRQDLVGERLQALRHTLLQFFITKVKVQSISDSGYSFGDLLARVFDKIACDKLGLPIVAISKSGVVKDPDIVQSRVNRLGLFPSMEFSISLCTGLHHSSNSRKGNGEAIEEIRQP